MKIEFAVASCCHMAGAGINYIRRERFLDYDSAKAYADTFNDCLPTIYIVINDLYVFYCHRSAVANTISWIYSIESKPWGQVETKIWWNKFIENPEAFFHLAVGKLGVEEQGPNLL